MKECGTFFYEYGTCKNKSATLKSEFLDIIFEVDQQTFQGYFTNFMQAHSSC